VKLKRWNDQLAILKVRRHARALIHQVTNRRKALRRQFMLRHPMGPDIEIGHHKHVIGGILWMEAQKPEKVWVIKSEQGAIIQIRESGQRSAHRNQPLDPAEQRMLDRSR
jgi:hypothetical protein